MPASEEEPADGSVLRGMNSRDLVRVRELVQPLARRGLRGRGEDEALFEASACTLH